MANPTAAYPMAIKIAPDNSGVAGTYTSVGNVSKATYGPKRTLIDATYFGGAGAEARFGVLADTDISLSGHYLPGTGATTYSADTAQNTVLASLLAGASDAFIWIEFLWSGATHGPSLQCICDSFKIDADTKDVFKFSMTAKGSGAVTYA
jgi:hypothetical protein